MVETKRGDHDLTESSSDANKRTRIDGGGNTTSGDLYPDNNVEEQNDGFKFVWNELGEEVASTLSRSVVSLALSDGHTVLFECSGIVVERKLHVTRFLTSANLVRAFNNNREDHDSLKIQVRTEGKVATGILGKYDLDQELALVNVVLVSLGVHAVHLNHQVGFLPHSKVIAVGRATSGKLMVTNGTLTNDSSGSEDSKGLMFSTCKISEGGTSFLPRSIIIEHLEQFLPRSEVKMVSDVERQRRELWKASMPYYSIPRDSLGYPKPSATMIRDGMVLVNTFEETFGDLYDSGEGVWSVLSKTYTRRRNTRLFAGTGLFIEWNGCITILTSASLVRDPDDGNKVDENLKIEVLLPNKQRKEGILQHYNLYYNVAVVSVKDFHALRSVLILDHWRPPPIADPNVVAVGCCFNSGMLMATRGKLVAWSGKLDSHDLRLGSEGLLLTSMGDYDKKIGTPFMSRRCIGLVLANFEGKGTVKGRGSKCDPIRWPVPVPCWRLLLDELEDRRPPGDDEGDAGPFGFGYIRGERVDYH